MKYLGRVTLPIKSMDSGQVVVYLGTFSKVLFPGVRTGWVIADPDCIRRLTAVKRFSDLSSSGVLHAALAEFCREGHYEAHVRRMHKVFRRRMEVAQAALRRHLPRELVTWTEPVGGYLVWVRFRGDGERRSIRAVLRPPPGRGVARAGLLPRRLAADVLPDLHFHARRAGHRGGGRPARPGGAGAGVGRGAVMTIELKRGMVYGPVASRRLGRSLGINLLPARDKVCRFDCVYCQYGATTSCDASTLAGELPAVDQVIAAVEDALHRLPEPPAWLTFSGNGEPTLHPDFPAAVDGGRRPARPALPAGPHVGAVVLHRGGSAGGPRRPSPASTPAS